MPPRRIISDDEEEDEPERNSGELGFRLEAGEEGDVDVEAEDEQPTPPGQDEEQEEEEVDIEEEDELSEKEDELADEDAEEQPDEGSDAEPLSSPPPDIEDEPEPSPPPTKLKIKLKLPAQGKSSAAPQDIDIESEDDEFESEEGQSTRSTSLATPGRALTARQAALANVVETTHVSLEEPPNPRKKKPLTELEMALKREETARKRKNLTEKKLEDEKAETINRLLKRQSRVKGKRNALASAEDRPTPLATTTNGGDADEEAAEGIATPAAVIPTMYRWLSRVQTVPKDTAVTEGPDEKVMVLSFSIPNNALPPEAQTQHNAGAAAMEIDQTQVTKQEPLCNVPGCSEKRKYRLVKDWTRGACGMAHLKVLDAQ
ncbi:hypothetical protein K474DRAFT_1733760 [Panus rudis PR-1116 ss-1]|nr:hypothetical protein K474DRAFT_1733760 [Panus rudis PR-1116 ss-1]